MPKPTAILLGGDRYHHAEEAFAGVGPALEAAGLTVEYTTDPTWIDTDHLSDKRLLCMSHPGVLSAICCSRHNHPLELHTGIDHLASFDQGAGVSSSLMILKSISEICRLAYIEHIIDVSRFERPSRLCTKHVDAHRLWNPALVVGFQVGLVPTVRLHHRMH